MTCREAAEYLKDGHFPAGSMKPKIEAAMQFVEKTGKRAVITSLKNIEKAVAGKAGTEVIAGLN
jgi:carbamate kinase